MEKLKPAIVALSLGITAVALYILCLVFIAVLPLQAIISFTNNLVHGIDVSSIAAKNITLAGSIAGIIGVFFIGAAAGYIFAFVYNWAGKKL